MDVPTLRTVAKHLQSTTSIGKEMKLNKDRRLPPLPVKRKLASNATSEEQSHFFLQRRKGENRPLCLSQRILNSVKALSSAHSEFCGICFSKEKELEI